MAITVAAETPLQDDVRRLIGELNATLLVLTPPEFCFHMTAEQMAQPDTTVFLAREDGVAVACGALRRHPERTGEVKRMYTVPSHQGRGLGGRILEEIEALARKEGLRVSCSRPGTAILRPGGCTSAPASRAAAAVLDYPDSEYSVFYEKVLAADSGPQDERVQKAARRLRMEPLRLGNFGFRESGERRWRAAAAPVLLGVLGPRLRGDDVRGNGRVLHWRRSRGGGNLVHHTACSRLAAPPLRPASSRQERSRRTGGGREGRQS